MKREIPLLFRQLAMASRAGLPLPEGLRIAAASCREGPLRRAVESVERSVRAGHPLANSLARYPQQFDEVEVALVAVGEEQGELDRVLTRLADRSERAYHGRQRLVFALLYPALLFLAALFLPKLHLWYRFSFGTYLLSVFKAAFPFLMVFGLLAAGVVLLRRASSETLDRLRLQLPVLGPNLKKLALARFSSCLAMLYAGGVELRQSLRLSIHALGNRFLERRCRPLGEILDKGGTISQGLASTRLFPVEMVNTVKIGEQTGDLDRALEGLARLYQEEAERAIKTLLILLPVAIYLLVALYIAIVVISAFSGYAQLIEGL